MNDVHAKKPVKVWDLPSRLCHWALALCFLGSYGSAEYGWFSMQWHFYFGYAAITLVLFRLLWGFFGSQHVRFRDFVRGPGAVWRYLCTLTDKNSTQSVGHSALGGWAVLVLLAATLAQGISGLFNSDDIEWFGPLNEKATRDLVDQMSAFHNQFGNILLLIIGLHVVASMLYLLLKKQNLIGPMITGVKRNLIAADAMQKPLWHALLLLGLSATALWALIAFWPAS
jgi:cytochrome b